MSDLLPTLFLKRQAVHQRNPTYCLFSDFLNFRTEKEKEHQVSSLLSTHTKATLTTTNNNT